VPEEATAFGYRDGGWAGVIVGVDPDRRTSTAISSGRRTTGRRNPTSAGGGYINFMMSEGQDRVKASYRGNYDRLPRSSAATTRTNIFHVNQNIQPGRRSHPVARPPAPRTTIKDPR